MPFTPRFICGVGNFPKRKLLAPEYLQLLLDLQNKKFIQPPIALGDITSELLEEGLLSYGASGAIHNSGMVIRISDGPDLFALAEQYSQGIQQIVKVDLDVIEREVKAIAEFFGQPFLKYSFFILSNVLLDNWQIRNVEEFYLGQNRPQRGSKNFYFAVMENSQDGRDPFGIYGNISRTVEKHSCCFYGNNQGALSSADFVELARKNEPLVLSQSANLALSKVALVVRDSLIGFFKSIDKELKDYHATSNWATITYAEFFIWWYHFLYTQVTNDLAKSGNLIIPGSGMYPYIIKDE